MSQYNQLLKMVMEPVITGGETSAHLHGNMSVYQEGYRLRMRQVLEGAYPALMHYIGAVDFGAMAENYIATNPSLHFNIDRYPIGFGISVQSDNAVIRELAKLESATAAIYFAEESAALTPDWITSQTPESFAEAKITLRKSARLLAFDYCVQDYATCVRTGENPGPPAHQKNWLLLYRHHHQIQRLAIGEGEYSLLTLLDGSMTLAQAIEHERFAPHRETALTSGEIMQWFARLTKKGCLCLTT